MLRGVHCRQGLAQQWPESVGFEECLNRSIEAPILVNTGFQCFWPAKMGKDFPNDEAFQAANDLTFAFSVFGALLNICEGRFVTSHPDNCDPI